MENMNGYSKTPKKYFLELIWMFESKKNVLKFKNI